MKYKITPSLFGIFLFLSIMGCNQHNKNNAENIPSKDSLSIPKDIHLVVGIGKVEPQKGIIHLASQTGGIVEKVFKASGDTVKKGVPIILLKQENNRLQIQAIQAKINTQKQQVISNKINVEQFEVQLENKEKKLSISRKLVQTGAETEENVADLETEKKVLETKLSKSKNEVLLSQAKIKELQSQLATDKNKLENKTIKAPSDGILLKIDVQRGSAVNALQSFATYAPNGPWIIHGEADEMFANQLKLGQKVSIHYIGNNHTITTGKIIALSPDLSNKSLFSDEPGEQQDRRVRRFKVLLNDKDNLLINSKVECNIYIKNNR